MNYLYLITSGKAVKIGISTDPVKRLTALQTSHYDKLEIYCTFNCDTPQNAATLEFTLHQRYLKHNIRGEWFQLDPELVLSDILSDKKLNIYTSSHKRYIYPNPPVIKDWHRNPDDEKAFLVSAIAISVILSAFSVSTYFSIGFPDWTVIVLPIMAFIFMVICAIILIKTLSRAL